MESAIGWINISIKGTTEEVFSMLKVIHEYTSDKKKNNVWFDNFVLKQKKKEIGKKENGEDFSFELLTEEDLRFFATKYRNGLIIEADGPYGDFKKLVDVAILRDMAEVAPNATLNASMSCGSPLSFDTQEIESYLNNGLLYIDTYCEDETLLDDGFEMQMQLCYNPISKKIVSSNPIDAGDE